MTATDTGGGTTPVDRPGESSREILVELTRRTLDHARAGTVPLAGDVVRVPAANYHDPERWRLEMDRVFRRLPLVVGFSAELDRPGAYKALDVAGVPVLLIRSPGGDVGAFVNACSHRGAIVAEGSGTARRFTCPYHAWSYDADGALVGILDRNDFGAVDPAELGLTPLPVAERSGLIFALVRQDAATRDDLDLDPLLDTFLCGYDRLLDHFGFADCAFAGSQRVDGPNWKVAYDGYLDFYHLPILHRESFGTEINNKAIYDAWGPHQRVSSPDPRLVALEQRPSDAWTDVELTGGVWTIFPHTSIATFTVKGDRRGDGGPMYMVSTLYPGAEPGTSVTVQTFLAGFEVTDELRPSIDAQRRFLHGVVRDEDYATGLGIQRALAAGAKTDVLFGRNEAGGQRFHGWVDRILAAETDEDLLAVFASAETAFQR
ncbi:MAG: aromatic ring-hydroxylating dioxygenase subunit alpha [Actinomycetota bacterium]